MARMPTIRVQVDADFAPMIEALERMAADLRARSAAPASRLTREAMIAGAAALAARPTKITRRALLGLWRRCDAEKGGA